MPADGDRVESSGAQNIVETQASQAGGTSSAAPAYIPQVIPHNFPLPSPMNCRGDVAGNWDFFKQQWNERPWSRVATDQFKLHLKEYIVLVDLYSDFIEVKDLHENTSTAVIEFLKEQFSRYGIPDTLATDNGPQFISQKFRQFSQDWEFLHVSS